MSDQTSDDQAGLVFNALNRRQFLTHAGVAGLSVAAPLGAKATNLSAEPQATEAPNTIPVTLKINGQTHTARIDPRSTLLDTLRETLHLTGTKKGC
ncbi:MAG: twin-arginine translocation signal domain-containing protein, partial [Povalibacter sp.]